MFKLPVNFIYHAQIIKKLCRKPVTVPVKTSMTVEISSFGSLPVAFKIKDQELFWDAGTKQLWKWSYLDCVDAPKERIKFETVARHTTNDGVDYKWSGAGVQAPFHNVWHDMYCGIDEWLKDEEVVLEPELKVSNDIRELVSDNRQDVIDFIRERASRIAVMGGFMLEKASEPMYYSTTFGMGSNHGGTALFVGETKEKITTEDFQFPANQLKQAIARTETIAKNRGDTKSLPIQPNGGVIEVLIPEAVQLVKKRPEPDYTKEPMSCPCCDSENISPGKLESDVGIVWRYVSCDDCGAKWREDFEFKSFGFLHRPDES